MSTVSEPQEAENTRPQGATVDPRAPRFGQATTATGLLVGIAFQRPILIYAVTATFLLAVGSRWRYDLPGRFFATLLEPRLGPREPEPATPHRFAKLVGTTGTTFASALFLAGQPLPAYAVAAVVATAAALGATTGICLGCRMYRSVSFFQRLNVI